MEILYRTKGTCAQAIKVALAPDDTIEEVFFFGGCDGNLKGIAKLVKGLRAEDVIARLGGTHCGLKKSSCPDQLALALQEALRQKAENAVS